VSSWVASLCGPHQSAVVMAYFPIQIDPLAGPNISIFGIQPFLNDPGVFRRGTDLYRCGSYLDITNVNGEYATRIWKSSNAGRTWKALDIANEPFGVYNYRCAVFDGLNTVTFAILPAAVPFGTGGPVFLQNFNLVTDTWGLPFGLVGAPTPLALSGLYRRSTGELVLISQYPDPGPLPNPNFGFQTFFGGVWSPIFDLGVNARALPLFPAISALSGNSGFPAVVDANDRLHVFFTVGGLPEDPIGWDARTFYQQVLANNTLGPFFDFPGQGVTPVDIQDWGNPVIDGDSLVWPVVRFLAGPITQYQDVYQSTPLAVPVWTALGPPGIDAASFGVFRPTSSPRIAFDGSQLFVSFIQTTDLIQVQNQLRICQSAAALAAWNAQTLFDYLTDPAPPGFNFNGQAMNIEPLRPGSLLTSVLAFSPNPPNLNALFFLAGPITGGIVILKGVKRVKASTCNPMQPAPVAKPNDWWKQ